jgi:transcriptional regulator with XRE-family HTH domain
MSLQKVFIANLKKYRGLQGLSQMKLAERCGTSTSYIGEIEIGVKFPSISMVERLATALRVQPHKLFEDEKRAAETVEAAFIPPIPEDIKKELANQLSQVISKIIKQY